MALMVLGQFVFELRTAPFQQIQRSTQQRWSGNDRVGKRAALQHLGPGEDAITLTGTLMPELTGGPARLDELRDMAATGDAHRLIDGQGYVLGTWVIEGVEETRETFFRDGTARKIKFTLQLKRDG